jgi:glycosyltransferase involved in cell wall biosynthesis
MKATVSVINDLSTDQRVHKVCLTLKSLGYDVVLVGRKQRNSISLVKRPYATHRMKLVFEKGVLFYVEYQLRLFLFLFFNKATVLVANDLDTLLPNYLITILRKAHLVYDTHEVFCEVPELQNNKFKKRIWKSVERFIFPKLKHVFTVNESIAELYSKEYNVEVSFVRNVPLLVKAEIDVAQTKQELKLPSDKKIIIMQGAGINIDRGAEEAVMAMQYIDDALLLIVGSGDVIPELKRLTEVHQLNSKILFVEKVPFEVLRKYTSCADIGLSLDKNTNVNYQLSLPNKLFDYIHCGVPVFASNLVEVKRIVEQYKVGCCISSLQAQTIADKINAVFADEKLILEWKLNTHFAIKELNWQKEEEKLKNVYSKFLNT